jgi:hypothetical protein
MFGPNMMQKQLEGMGFPTPQPPKEYHQRYPESLTRLSLSLLVGLLIRLIQAPLSFGCTVWLVTYLSAVVGLYLMNVPKGFAVGHEIQLLFQHFCAFFLIYIFVDNAISTFAE